MCQVFNVGDVVILNGQTMTIFEYPHCEYLNSLGVFRNFTYDDQAGCEWFDAEGHRQKSVFDLLQLTRVENAFENEEFAVGDVVKLKSGGPQMTVTEYPYHEWVHALGISREFVYNDRAECQFTDEEGEHTEIFLLTSLRKAEN